MSTAKLSTIAAGAFLAGGLVGYILSCRDRNKTKTIDVPTTTITQKETSTITQTITHTKTLEIPIFHKLTKGYSSYEKLMK
ncbi:MAG: hypothetical protein NZ870_04210 [bacterium]|nr:hypothetical protein [bacterium]